MKTLRRYDIHPASYFITVVTFERRPILLRDPQLFMASWESVRPIAWVMLPDHFHAIVAPDSMSISRTVYDFKMHYRYAFQREFEKGRIFQHRFWDHMIRSGEDLLGHLNYIHFNAVKHGYASSPQTYPHSSFGEWVRQGYYEPDWGVTSQSKLEGEFGE